MNKTYKILICLLLIYQGLSAQTFHLRTAFDYPSAVITSVYPIDSMYYVSGIVVDSFNSLMSNPLFAKFDLNGNLLDKKVLRTANRTFGLWSSTLYPTSDGNLVVAGYYSDIGLNMFACLIKYNTNGDTLWMKSYPNPIVTNDFMRLDDMSPTPDGGFILSCTYVNWAASHHDISVIKTDSLGQVEWHRTYGDPVWNDLAPYVYVESDTNYIVSWGKINNNLAGWPPRVIQSKIVWLDLNGGIIDSFSSDTTNGLKVANAIDLMINSAGEYIIGSILGTEVGGNNVDENAYIYKLDNNKQWLWGKIIANHYPSVTSTVNKLFELPDSNFIAIGSRPDPNLTHEIGFMMKLSPEGDSLWQRNYAYLTGQADWNEVYDARRCPDGGYIICGESREYYATTQRQQGWLLKLDSMGCLIPGCHLTAVENIAGAAEKIAIKIFPNPVQAGEYLNFYIPAIVQTRFIASLRAHLYNMEGKLIQNHSLPSDDATYMLSTEGMAAGTYILQVLDAEGRILGTEKIVFY